MVGLKNKRREKHEPELCLIMVKCKMKWNKNRYFVSPQELNPHLQIQSMSFKCSKKTTANSCLCMKLSFDIWALRSVWKECPQCTKGPWWQEFFSGRDELLWPWHAMGLFCLFFFFLKSWGISVHFSAVKEHGWNLQQDCLKEAKTVLVKK